MSALSYLTLTQLKNRIRGVFRSPAKLIYAVIVIALLVFVVFAGNMDAAEGGAGKPNSQLGAIIVGYFAIMFLMTANSGFSTGMSIFKMSDVNFLFVGPFRPVRVLFHGMLNQMGTALIMAFFILFQYGWMHGSYGVGPRRAAGGCRGLRPCGIYRTDNGHGNILPEFRAAESAQGAACRVRGFDRGNGPRTSATRP